MNKLIEKYFRLLHPNFMSDYESKEGIKTSRHEKFIIENIEQIDKEFRRTVEEQEKKGAEIDEEKIMVEVLNKTRVDKYFGILYPNFKEMSSEEQEKAMLDKEFILEYGDELDEEIDKAKRRIRVALEDMDGRIVRVAFCEELKDQYHKLLFQGYEELNLEEQDKVWDDEDFMLENIEEIHKEFKIRIIEARKINQEIDKQSILRDVIEGVRAKKNKNLVTPKDIAKISKEEGITSSQIETAEEITTKQPAKEQKKR